MIKSMMASACDTQLGFVTGAFEIAFAFGGKVSSFHIAIVGAERSLDDFKRIGVGAQKFRLEARIEPEHVLVNEYLTAHIRAGPDADRRYLEQLRCLPRGLGRYAFEH